MVLLSASIAYAVAYWRRRGHQIPAESRRQQEVHDRAQGAQPKASISLSKGRIIDKLYTPEAALERARKGRERNDCAGGRRSRDGSPQGYSGPRRPSLRAGRMLEPAGTFIASATKASEETTIMKPWPWDQP